MGRAVLLLTTVVAVLLAYAGVAPAQTSADPGRIAYIGRSSSALGAPTDIFTMKPDGTDVKQLDRPGDQFYPAISPDGNKSAYTSSRYDSQSGQFKPGLYT